MDPSFTTPVKNASDVNTSAHSNISPTSVPAFTLSPPVRKFSPGKRGKETFSEIRDILGESNYELWNVMKNEIMTRVGNAEEEGAKIYIQDDDTVIIAFGAGDVDDMVITKKGDTCIYERNVNSITGSFLGPRDNLIIDYSTDELHIAWHAT